MGIKADKSSSAMVQDLERIAWLQVFISCKPLYRHPGDGFRYEFGRGLSLSQRNTARICICFLYQMSACIMAF